MRYSTLEKLINVHFNIISYETKQVSNNNAPLLLVLFNSTTNSSPPKRANIQQALNYIQKHQQESIFILTDFAEHLDNIFVERALLNFAKSQSKKLFLLDEKMDLAEKFRGIALETKKLFQMKLLRAA